jgi:hypothetical protein
VRLGAFLSSFTKLPGMDKLRDVMPWWQTYLHGMVYTVPA